MSLTDSVCYKNEPLITVSITAYAGQKQTNLSTLTSNSIYNNSVNPFKFLQNLNIVRPKSKLKPLPQELHLSYINIVTLQSTELNAAVDGCLNSLHAESMQSRTLEQDA